LKAKILIVEDHQDILSLLKDVLSEKYLVGEATDGIKALSKFKEFKPDLVVLDLMLPGIMGESVLKTIRKTSAVPILVLTAIQDKQKVVELLTLGANDYLTKPFDIDELLARVQVQLRGRKVSNILKQMITYKEIQVDPQTHTVLISGQNLALPKKEFEILKLLVENPHQVFEKEQLYEMIWGEPYINAENTLNVHISNLRIKIGALLTDSKYVKSIWGIGVRLD
jgi:two-component system response regulator RegX3